MKPFFLFSFLLFSTNLLQAQRLKSKHKTFRYSANNVKTCPTIVVDLTFGTVTSLKATASVANIKTKLPCFTRDIKEASDCEGGVFYADKDLFFYPQRDFIEIRKNFKGVFKKDGLELDIIGMEVKTFNILMGDDPTRTLNEDDGDNFTGVWAMVYGSLRVTFAHGIVTQVAIHAQSPDKIKVCD